MECNNKTTIRLLWLHTHGPRVVIMLLHTWQLWLTFLINTSQRISEPWTLPLSPRPSFSLPIHLPIQGRSEDETNIVLHLITCGYLTRQLQAGQSCDKAVVNTGTLLTHWLPANRRGGRGRDEELLCSLRYLQLLTAQDDRLRREEATEHHNESVLLTPPPNASGGGKSWDIWQHTNFSKRPERYYENVLTNTPNRSRLNTCTCM